MPLLKINQIAYRAPEIRIAAMYIGILLIISVKVKVSRLGNQSQVFDAQRG